MSFWCRVIRQRCMIWMIVDMVILKLRIMNIVCTIYRKIFCMKLLTLTYITMQSCSEADIYYIYIFIHSYKLGSFIIVWIYFDRIGFWKNSRINSSSSGHLKSILDCIYVVHAHYERFSRFYWHFCKSIIFAILYPKVSLN